MTTIHLARADEVSAIRTLVESAYRGDAARGGWTHEADLLEGDRTSFEDIAALIAAPDKRMLVAERGGRLVGSVAISAAGPGRAYLGMLSVDPALQAEGLGRALIAAAETEAVTSLGATVMEMTVIDRREELIRYYERRGYRRTGETRSFPYTPAEPVDFAMVVLARKLS